MNRINRLFLTQLIAVVVLLSGLGAHFAAAQETVDDKVDVRREVWPILRQRCLYCHDQKNARGDLRLDSKAAIEEGGHTGRKILGTEEDSELLRRITSTDIGYRMPKEETPLSESQIDTLRRWIRQGAPWPNNVAIHIDDDRPWLKEWFSEAAWNERIEYSIELKPWLSVVYWPLLGFFLFMAYLLRRKRLRPLDAIPIEQRNLLDRVQARFGLPECGVTILLCILVGVIQFHRMTLQAKNEEIESLSQQVPQQVSLAQSHNSRFAVPIPLRPKHPPRLGGVYYRGNDERNPKLFNGGYYRTATMTVALIDEGGKQLQWKDVVSEGDLAIELVIERAPSATPSLFNDESLKLVILTKTIDPTEAADSFSTDGDAIRLESLVSGEKWRARYPIGSPSLKGEDQLTGLIYLCSSPNSPHYGIQYQLYFNNGSIEEKSEVWMGATFFTGPVYAYPEGNIPPNEWFDFLPIPEITGQNSNDPALLGIQPSQ
jgi:hypothetical protein